MTWERRLKEVARRTGLEIGRYTPNASPAARRARILDDNRISLALDVGAHTGDYVLDLRAAGYRGRIVSFEPLREPFCRLAARAARDPLWECRQVALGASDGTLEMNVAGNSASSSVLGMSDRHAEAAPHARYIGRETVEVRRLDSVADELTDASHRLFVKLDVQGFEGAVLDGAPRTLERTSVLELELSLAPLYDGQPLFREMLDRLEATGFVLVGVDPEFSDPRSGHVLQVNGLFVRSRVDAGR